MRRWFLAWALLAMTTPAVAAPVTYLFTGGSANISANTFLEGKPIVAPTGALPLSGTFVEFDDVVPSLIDFEIQLAPTGLIPMVNPYGGFSSFEVISAKLEPDVGFLATVTPLGGGQFSVSASGVRVDAVYGVSPPPTGPFPLVYPTTFTGTIDIVAMTLELDEFSLGLLPGGDFGETYDLLVQMDVLFEGQVPEPQFGLLLGLAAGTLFVRGRLLRTSPPA